jgi:hypothetical protein
MKKLLILLLCVPFIGFGQIKVVKSNQKTIIGDIKNFRLERKNNKIYLSYNNQSDLDCNKDLQFQLGLIMVVETAGVGTKEENSFETVIEINDEGTVLIDLFNLIQNEFDGLGEKEVDRCSTGESKKIQKKENKKRKKKRKKKIDLNEIYGTSAMSLKYSDVYKPGVWNFVRALEISIGESEIITLRWVGSKQNGEMIFSYKGNHSYFLNLDDIKKLFDNE